jgi:hypothetical protein
MLSHGIPPIVVAGMLGHSLAILMTTYAHIARFARDASNIPGTQDEQLGFAVTCSALWRSLASATCLMDKILTPIPIDIRDLGWAAEHILPMTGLLGDSLEASPFLVAFFGLIVGFMSTTLVS